jgi:hypothetical protein
MHAVYRSKSLMALLLSAVLFILCALPVSAAGEIGTSLEIRVKVGSSQMKINGATIKIQPPYQTSGTLMVPLSVLTNTKGFGAKLQLKNNKVITLTYQKHVIILTKGSKSATIDTKKAALAAAPVDKQGVTMVPLAILVKTFGAKMSNDTKTKEIIITGSANSSSSSGGSGTGIDSDSGKSQIGDSYHKWSMNYPTGLVQELQQPNGEWISFADVKGDYYMAVGVVEATDQLDTEEKRDWLSNYPEEDETLVDIKTITRPTGTFERMVTKSKNGFFYEYRGIQANGYFYILIFGKKAKSASDLDANSALVDSFKTSFDLSNKSLKDLSRVKDGKITFENADYGLKLQLPKDWKEDKKVTNPSYYGLDNQSLWFQVNSIKQGDTLEGMVNRKLEFYKKIAVEKYQITPKVSPITWNGVPALLVEYSYSKDTKIWWSEYEVYAFKGNYKYYVNYTFEKEKKVNTQVILDEILNGMKIDFSKVEKSFGEVPDPNDSIDLETLLTKTSKLYGYSLTMPKYWTKGTTDMDKNDLRFYGYGMDFTVTIEENATLEGYAELIEKNYTGVGTLKVDSKTSVTFAGVSATKFELSSTQLATNFIHLTAYLFQNKGNVYLVQGILNDTYATELNSKQLQDALNSFQFNN